MKQFLFLFIALGLTLGARSQVCVTQQIDTRSPELIEEIERELADANFDHQRSVTYLQTVVHVLWNNPNDNLTDSVVQANLDLVNKDLRRQNADTSLTPDYFLTDAADTEIELRLAQVDPNGQATTGITHTYSDSSMYEFGHMKYDSTGGKSAWDTQHYLNIWIVRQIDVNSQGGGITLGAATLPGSLPEEESGLVLRTGQFSANDGWRTITHELGHFTCLLHPTAHDSCYDADLVADTPIGKDTFVVACSDTAITCDNGPYGNMHMNYMSYTNPGCANIFTEGQKARMLNCIQTQMPGLLEYYYLGVDDAVSQSLKVSPNPTSDLLHFQSTKSGSFSILDVQGRTILSGKSASGKNVLDVSEIPPGVYLFRLQSESELSSARFIKN
ncbi:MAG: zinc-dependent metalloprotease [Flavobacteriales bacterium]|nr:zinc-dependent metalloprotease [Flavobacteriales bacterium]